ncbi:MAG: PBP1A family penicillin-binding protein, partial [Magnetococcus sp. XQGC-1]
MENFDCNRIIRQLPLLDLNKEEARHYLILMLTECLQWISTRQQTTSLEIADLQKRLDALQATITPEQPRRWPRAKNGLRRKERSLDLRRVFYFLFTCFWFPIRFVFSMPKQPVKSWRKWLRVGWRIALGLSVLASIVVAVATYLLWDTLPTAQQIREANDDLQILMVKNGENIQEQAVFSNLRMPPEHMPKLLKQAFIAAEDRRFYHHHGIDPLGIATSLLRAVLSVRRLGGGSTITQQAAKNLFFHQKRSVIRKLKELVLAFKLERYFSKDDILGFYLNNAYFGGNTYGVKTAAREFFAKQPDALNLFEVAMLAGTVKGPNFYHVQKHADRAKLRAVVVLGQMVREGFITSREAETAKKRGIEMGELPWQPIQHQYLRDWILPDIRKQLGNFEGQFRVFTTLNPEFQLYAEASLHDALDKARDHQTTQGAVLGLSPDGAVLAMFGGANFQESQLNRCTQSLRQPGSTIKPLLYLAALESGMTPASTVEDQAITIDGWSPTNFDDRFFGTLSLEKAFVHSRNTVAVNVLQNIGVEKFRSRLRSLGLNRELPADFTIALGSGEMTMLELTTLYAILANGGHAVEPYALKGISDVHGSILYWRQAPKSVQLIDPKLLQSVQEMMQKVISEGTGRQASFGQTTLAGKTGTSQNYRDAWFLGFSPQLIGAVWLGNDDNTPMNKVTGGSFPARIWRRFMANCLNSLNLYQD